MNHSTLVASAGVLVLASMACSSRDAPSGANGGSGGSHAGAGGANSGSTGGGVNGGSSPGGAGDAASGSGGTRPLGPPPDFGPNVLIFDPETSMDEMQQKLDSIIEGQASDQFGPSRYAFFFKPGEYDLQVHVGYYTQVLGLGLSPDDVSITGSVRSDADWFGGNATHNFWRGTENVSVTPTDGPNVWAVSQACSFRRMHIKGALNLWDDGWSSGGFIADSKIDSGTNSGSQQQFFVRNTHLTGWQGGGWNMVFVGTAQPPSGEWPDRPYTVIEQTPVLREKPFLTVDADGHYFVQVPTLRRDSNGPSWGESPAALTAISTDDFYVAKPDDDTAQTINAALASGKHLLLTPGIYSLDEPIEVTQADTIVLGLGLATLEANGGTAAMTVSDVSGVIIAGVLFDAGASESETLLEIGPAGSSADHSDNPSFLFDVYCRVGGAHVGRVKSCVTINSHDVVADHLWMWRADHGDGVGWGENTSDTGITVNGDRVTIYGLFVEHFQRFQTLWNGEGGRVYFYQSETPYDAPSQSAWEHDGVKGYASYKVAPTVTAHQGFGLGVYGIFHAAPVVSENAIETPTAAGVSMQHMVTMWLGSEWGSEISHIINGTGGAVNQGNTQAKTDY